MISFVLAALLAQSSPEVAQEGVTVDAVEIRGVYPHWKLTAAVQGDVSAATLITIDEPPMACGGPEYRYAPGPVRLCWVWLRADVPHRLTASDQGRFGADWTVEWRGCEPVDDGRSCQLTLGRASQVEAVFRRLRG